MPENFAVRQDAAVRALQQELTTLSRRLRVTSPNMRPSEPRYVSYDRIRQAGGVTLARKKVILMSGGCSVPTCTMCPFTNENNHGLGWDEAALLRQVEETLRCTPDEPSYDAIALYNDGSFFAPKEVPRSAQLRVAELVSESGVGHLIVESLPQFVTARALSPFLERLGQTTLEVGIGLQSANELVRETLVNTRVSRNTFERAVETMVDLGVTPKIYLMIKPPFLTEEEACSDVEASVQYLRRLEVNDVTLCPTRVAPNTVAAYLHDRGHYSPPNLWTVVRAVRLSHEKANVRVACINLRGTDFDSVFPESCPECADMIVDSLQAYSETGDISVLPQECSCAPSITSSVLNETEIVSRSLGLIRFAG